MSDRSQLKNLDNPVDQGNSTLDTLRASKELGSEPFSGADMAGPGPDLSQVSIASSGVPRVSAKSDRRIIRTSTKASALSQDGPANDSDPVREKPKSASQNGILKNPHYRYEGNLIDRFVTLVANILKVLERIFIKLLGGGDNLPAPVRPQAPILPDQREAADPEKKKREEEDLRDRALSIHRS